MIEWLNSVSPSWWKFMISMTTQNALFISGILLILNFLKDRPARFLKMIALVGLVKLFIPPFIPGARVEAMMPSAIVDIELLNLQFITSTISESSSVWSILTFLMLAWILCVTSIIIGSLVKTIRLQWDINDASEIKSPINDTVLQNRVGTVLRSSHIKSPYIWGLFKHRLVLPPNWDGWDKKVKKTVIAHETAHIKEGDHWINLFKLIAFAFHFYNPFVWFLYNRLNHYSEMVCDDYAIHMNRLEPKEYNQQLLKIAEDTGNRWACEPALPFSKAHKMIKDRIIYQNNKKEEKFMSKLPKKSTLFVALLGITIFLFSWQCSQNDSSNENKMISDVAFGQDAMQFPDVDVKPKIEENISPIYPDSARKAGIEGLVVVTLIIDENGNVEDGKILKSIPALDQAALDAAMTIKFYPAQHAGKPVKVAMNVPFQFKLKDDKFRDAIDEVKSGYNSVYHPKQVDENAEILKRVDPKYPKNARKKGISGSVILAGMVDIEGKINNLKVVESIPELDEAALVAVEQWVFKPAKKNGEAVNVIQFIPVTFKLK